MKVDQQQVKKNILIMQQMNHDLKKEFFGIDNVIDKITHNLTGWFNMPPISTAPLIINLWGQTGTGKTSLVRRVAEYLNIALMQIDMGKLDKYVRFGDEVKDNYSEFAMKPCIILLDEFQKCRTIKNDCDVEDNALRDLWTLLSEGTIYLSDYYNDVEELLLTLQRWHNDSKEAPERKERNKARKDLQKEMESLGVDFSHFSEENRERVYYLLQKEQSELDEEYSWRRRRGEMNVNNVYGLENTQGWNKHYFDYHYGKSKIEPYELKRIAFVTGQNIEDLNEKFKRNFQKTLEESIDFISSKRNVNAYLNFQRSMIFVCGNLDDLYMTAYRTSPREDADTLYELSKGISVPMVKSNLLHKFKLEQIARMGNLHVVYPSLNKKAYRNIIRKELDNITEIQKENLGVEFIFDETVIDLVYSQGVYASQGTRPVFSTIKCLIESNVPNFIREFVLSGNTSVRKVNVSFDWDNTRLVWKSRKYTSYSHVDIEIEREVPIIPTDLTSCLAVREAGEALGQVLYLKRCPATLTAYSGGEVDLDKVMQSREINAGVESQNDYLNIIRSLLARTVAEAIIFGDSYVSKYAAEDLEAATSYATKIVCKYGKSPIQISSHRSSSEDLLVRRKDSEEEEISNVIRQAKSQVMTDISKYKEAVLHISRILIDQKEMKAEETIKILKQHGIKMDKKFSHLDHLRKNGAQYVSDNTSGGIDVEKHLARVIQSVKLN